MAPTTLSDDAQRGRWLIVASAGVWFSLGMWLATYNNFGVEIVGASGKDIGWQQSIRELPGLLAFTAVLWLALLREQKLALVSILLHGLGIMATGFFPSLTGFFVTTFIMSVGYHYYETMSQSLSLQWLKKDVAPIWLGRMVSAAAIAQLLAFGAVWISFKFLGIDYKTAYLIAGAVTLATGIFLILGFPQFPEGVPQTKKLFMRKRYWLYYLLNVMQGARRQIFLVFASYMLVKLFNYSVSEVATLFFINCAVNMVLAPRLGALISKLGERWSLTWENLLLVAVFGGYAFCAMHPSRDYAWLAALLFCVDGISVTLGIAIKTYFQKIGDAADMASQAGVAFSINHIMAVIVPVVLGLLWEVSPPAVFIVGVGCALISFSLARLVPGDPRKGYESVLAAPAPAE